MSLLGRAEWSWRELSWYAVAVLLFAGLLYFADTRTFLDALGRVDRSIFAVGIGVGLLSLFVWAWVWHRFFGQLSITATPTKTVRLFFSGHFLNSVTPLGQFGGEPVMAYIIADTTDSEYEGALAAVVSSDLVNAVPFFTFTIGGVGYLYLFGSLQGFLFDIGWIAFLILLFGGGVAYLLWSPDGTLGRAAVGLLTAIDRRVGWGDGIFRSLQDRIRRTEALFERAGRDRAFLLTTIAGSHLAIVAQIVSLYVVFLAMGLEPTIVPLYFIVNLSTIATLSPTPGGSGTYEAAFSWLMTLFYSVDLATALTAAVLFRLTTYWPGLVVGFLTLLTLDREGDVEPPQEAEL
jgi:uncharacterized protein (TIRG00374 family)